MLALISLYLSGCVLTKVVTVPMRVTGSVISVIPVVGDGIDEVLEQSADIKTLYLFSLLAVVVYFVLPKLLLMPLASLSRSGLILHSNLL